MRIYKIAMSGLLLLSVAACNNKFKFEEPEKKATDIIFSDGDSPIQMSQFADKSLTIDFPEGLSKDMYKELNIEISSKETITNSDKTKNWEVKVTDPEFDLNGKMTNKPRINIVPAFGKNLSKNQLEANIEVSITNRHGMKSTTKRAIRLDKYPEMMALPTEDDGSGIIQSKNGDLFHYSQEKQSEEANMMLLNEKTKKPIYIEYNSEKLPSTIIFEDNIFVVSNYKDGNFDLAHITKDREIKILRKINYNIPEIDYSQEAGSGDRFMREMAASSVAGCAITGAIFEKGEIASGSLTDVSKDIKRAMDEIVTNITGTYNYAKHNTKPTDWSVERAIDNPALPAEVTSFTDLTGFIDHETTIVVEKKEENSELIDNAEGSLSTADGFVKVTLTWDFVSDLDLHVEDPDGYHIYWGKPTSPNGGWLDTDNMVAYGPENITWTDSDQQGFYRVFIHHYKGSNSGNYTVRVQIGDMSKMFFGQIAAEQIVQITFFNLKGEFIFENPSSLPSKSWQPTFKKLKSK